MQVVPRAEFAPGCCALSGEHEGPHLDTEYYFNAQRIGINARVYVHVPVVETMGRAVGMVTKADHESALEEIKTLQDANAQLEQELNEANTVVDAVQLIEKRKPPTKVTPKRKVAA